MEASLIWCGGVGCDVVWCGVVWCGGGVVVGYGVVWCFVGYHTHYITRASTYLPGAVVFEKSFLARLLSQ